MQLLHRLRRFLRLSNSDRYSLFSTCVVLNLIRLGLFFLPFKLLRQLLERFSFQETQLERLATDNPNFTALTELEVQRTVWAIAIVSRYLPGQVKCLAKALTAQVLLRRKGYSTDLRIGVAKNHLGQLEAHAWVERQGRVIIGNLHDLSRYIPLTSPLNEQKFQSP